MSTLPNQPSISPSWKQEVNRRIAEHRSRQASSASGLEGNSGGNSESQPSTSARAAAAAARVAARYANAPSYSDQLADEARAAVRAAEAASRAALQAQAAAEHVLAGLEAASAAEPLVWELHSSPATAPAAIPAAFPAAFVDPQAKQAQPENPGPEPVLQQALPVDPVPDFDRQSFEIRWEPDLPTRHAQTATLRATRGAGFSEEEMENQTVPAWPAPGELDEGPIEPVEPAQPIHANLIEFPREIVATRKVRPRRAEGAFAVPESQLSIFEVDPAAVSVEPAPSYAAELGSAPALTDAEWPGIRLDAQPRRELLEEFTLASRHRTPQEPPEIAVDAPEGAPALSLAPLNLRLMAAVVNGSLIAGASLVAAIVALANAKSLPSLREIEVGWAIALLVVGALYHALFFALSAATPGMMYAGLSLSTFDDRTPTRAQRWGRLGALPLSLLPMGLGVVWAIFDDDHLSWHDRLSGTYLRKS